jgi:hypothetical protein
MLTQWPLPARLSVLVPVRGARWVVTPVYYITELDCSTTGSCEVGLLDKSRRRRRRWWKWRRTSTTGLPVQTGLPSEGSLRRCGVRRQWHRALNPLRRRRLGRCGVRWAQRLSLKLWLGRQWGSRLQLTRLGPQHRLALRSEVCSQRDGPNSFQRCFVVQVRLVPKKKTVRLRVGKVVPGVEGLQHVTCTPLPQRLAELRPGRNLARHGAVEPAGVGGQGLVLCLMLCWVDHIVPTFSARARRGAPGVLAGEPEAREVGNACVKMALED